MSKEREPLLNEVSLQVEDVFDNTDTETETPVVKTSYQVHFVIADNIKRMMKNEAIKEERTLTVVINKAIRKFIEEEVCEDRPYIPIELSKKTKLTFTIQNDLMEKLNARAKNEGRSVNVLLEKAFTNYLREIETENAGGGSE